MGESATILARLKGDGTRVSKMTNYIDLIAEIRRMPALLTRVTYRGRWVRQRRSTVLCLREVGMFQNLTLRRGEPQQWKGHLFRLGGGSHPNLYINGVSVPVRRGAIEWQGQKIQAEFSFTPTRLVLQLPVGLIKSASRARRRRAVGTF